MRVSTTLPVTGEKQINECEYRGIIVEIVWRELIQR